MKNHCIVIWSPSIIIKVNFQINKKKQKQTFYSLRLILDNLQKNFIFNSKCKLISHLTLKQEEFSCLLKPMYFKIMTRCFFLFLFLLKFEFFQSNQKRFKRKFNCLIISLHCTVISYHEKYVEINWLQDVDKIQCTGYSPYISNIKILTNNCH